MEMFDFKADFKFGMPPGKSDLKILLFVFMVIFKYIHGETS